MREFARFRRTTDKGPLSQRSKEEAVAIARSLLQVLPSRQTPGQRPSLTKPSLGGQSFYQSFYQATRLDSGCCLNSG